MRLKMSGSLTKNRLIEKIQTLGYTHKQAAPLLEAVLQSMKETLESGENLKISGFGNFVVKQKEPRRGRNPQTGEDLTIEARKVISFKASSILKDLINKEKE
jgi:integration host factor subunit alpha